MLKGKVAELYESMDAVLSLYTAPFLSNEEDEASWALPFRERLHVKVVTRIRDSAAHAERNAQSDAAISLYQRGLEIDDLVEDFYRGMMRCHASRGEKSEVIKVYRRCQRLLSARLGVEPSSETKRLYFSLVPNSPA